VRYLKYRMNQGNRFVQKIRNCQKNLQHQRNQNYLNYLMILLLQKTQNYRMNP
jgi:hypothetical protein